MLRHPLFAATIVAFATFVCCLAAPSGDLVVRPVARVQSEPVPHGGDAADDPAIWVHTTDPEKSLILGTDKQGGLHAYNLDGRQVQVISKTAMPDNVDVLYSMKGAAGPVDVAVASCRSRGARGVKVWTLDAESGALKDATQGGVIPVFGATEPYGICAYRSPKTGKAYFFVNSKSGAIEQHEMEFTQEGLIKATLVRKLKLGSVVEGCVADNELGVLYVAEEGVGIWKFQAEPDASGKAKLIHKAFEHGLTPDVEGLTIYYGDKGKGYLIASSQGSNTFNVYERDGDNAFVLIIDPADGDIDDVNDTDGIDVINLPLGRNFPKGMFIVQDGGNRGGNQNFKLYGWESIAGDKLRIDTAHPVRPN